jgi:hypothetical protein
MKSPAQSLTCPHFFRGLAFLLLLLASGQLPAQTDSIGFRPHFLFGGQYGFSWNQLRFSPTVSQTTLPGNRYSLVGRYIEAPNLGVQVEISYDQRGWAEQRDTLTSTYEQQIDYLELGLFSHFTIGKGAVRPLILLGSFLSVPVADSRALPSDWSVAFPAYYSEPLERRLQYGLAGGLGLQADFGPLLLQLDGRYRYALSNIFASGEGSDFTFSQSNGILASATLFLRIN